MYKNKKTGIVGIIITSVILIILVFMTNIKIEKISGVESVCNKLVMPIQNVLAYIKNKVSGNGEYVENIASIRAENETLKIENKMLKAENTVLREYSNMTDLYTEYTTVPAYIIDKDSSNLSKIIVINVGTDNGVYKNMPVISEGGLVGHVISSTNNTAKVQTIIDSSSSTSGIMDISKNNVIIKGQLNEDKLLKATYISTDADLVLDDTIETSGLGGIYPKGIAIGKLKEIIQTNNIIDRYAIIETSVDFSKLETVLVITKQ